MTEQMTNWKVEQNGVTLERFDTPKGVLIMMTDDAENLQKVVRFGKCDLGKDEGEQLLQIFGKTRLLNELRVMSEQAQTKSLSMT